MVRNRLAGLALAALTAVQPIALQAQEAQAAVATSPGVPDAMAPRDALERGLWMQVDEGERDLRRSALIVTDPAINAYVRDVLCRTVGAEKCAGVRLYLMRTPDFNATMAPNGAMQIWTGLLLRTQNEAQLAAVLGHEFTHFENRHSVRIFREAKEKSTTAAWLAFTGVGLLAAIAMEGTLFKFSRDMEKEADMGGLAHMAQAGYDTRQSARIWQQVLDEYDAGREARGQKPKKRKSKAGLFDSHPPSAERLAYLTAAAEAQPGGGDLGIDRYREAMAKLWPQLVDDQLKMNDFGGSEYLLDSLDAVNGTSPWLRYARAEFHRRRGGEGDFARALELYDEAIARGGSLPEIWRGRGMVLRKLGRAEEGRSDLAQYLHRVPDAADAAMVTMLAGGN